MLKPGDTVRLGSGRQVLIERQLGDPGGQGVAFLATVKRSGEPCVIKIFTDSSRQAQDRERCRQLVAYNLPAVSPLLYGPTDLVDSPDWCGHFSAFFPGQSLTDFIYPASGVLNTSLQDDLIMAALLAHALHHLHRDLKIIVGDVSRTNALAVQSGGIVKVAQIDFDNWGYANGHTPSHLEPPMMGQVEFMAPEIRQAHHSAKRPVHTEESEMFPAAVLFHEIIFHRHPVNDKIAEAFDEGMMQPWAYDPTRASTPPVTSGYPVRALPPELLKMFAKSINPDPSGRASAADWRDELCKAAGMVAECPHCGGHMVAHLGQYSCPYPECGRRFPPFELHLPGGRQIRVDTGSFILGRDLLGGANTISHRHCTLRKCGPVLVCEPEGLNPTTVVRNGNVVPLANGEAWRVDAGDRLRIADIEAIVALGSL